MKTVYQNNQIAHIWANQQQSHARNGKNTFYFRDSTIYSYGGHFPIATIIEKPGKPKTVLFTSRTYSMSTSQHISYTRQACSQFPIISCNDPLEALHGNHYGNIECWDKEASQINAKLLKARKPEMYIGQLDHIKNLFLEYCEFFDLNPLDFSLSNLDTDLTDEQKEDLQKKQNQARERAQKALEKNIQDFRNFDINMVTDSEYSYLRFNDTAERIETSQGIQIPLNRALQGYDYLCKILDKSIDGKHTNLFGYPLIGVNANYVRIGCHKIKTQEFHNIAAQVKNLVPA